MQITDGDPPISSRTPIACSNCATAKAGCDKKVPCSRCADKNLACAPRFARRSSKGTVPRSAAAATNSNRSPTSQYQNSIPTRTGSELDLSTEAQMNRVNSEVSLQENPPHSAHSDVVPMWGQSHKDGLDHGQGFQYSAHNFELMKPQGGVRVEDFLGTGNGDFDPAGMDLESINLWTNGSLDVDMCANEGLDFSNHTSLLYFPSNLGLGERLSDNVGIPPVPSPSASTSMSHSRTNSSSNIWQGRIDTRLQEQAMPFLGQESGSIPELDIVIAAEEAWPFVRCNPRIFSGACPRTAIVHLQELQNISRLDEAWSSLNHQMSPIEIVSEDQKFTIVPLMTTTRDKIIAFAQSFLLKALRTHHSGINSGYLNSGSGGIFFTLPPSNVLENLLRGSVRSLSPYYSLLYGATLDPNELMLDNDSSTLLFLLMLAQGATHFPKAEARFLAAGLTETCRISLFDVIEKNVELSADPLVLKSALLLTILCAWGGDAWHIKMAMGGQRGMYLAVS